MSQPNLAQDIRREQSFRGPVVVAILACVALVTVFVWFGVSREQAMKQERQRTAAQFCADASITKLHWREDFTAANPDFGDAFAMIAPGFTSMEFESDLLTLDAEPEYEQFLPPADNHELALVTDLESEWKQQLAALVSQTEDAVEDRAAAHPVFAERYEEVNGHEYYVYYQPVYWKESCVTACHGVFWATGQGAPPSAGQGRDNNNRPLRVVRVRMPVED